MASLILLALVATSFLPPLCRVAEDDLTISMGDFSVIVAEPGYIIATRMNITNKCECALHISAIEVRISRVTYQGNETELLDSTDVEPRDLPIMPNETRETSYVFQPYFQSRPVLLALHIILHVDDMGDITVFQGEMRIPSHPE